MTKNENSSDASPNSTAQNMDSGRTHLPTLTRASLNALCDAGGMSPAAWLRAMDFCGFRPEGNAWLAYGRQLCLLGGALFFVAGVVCFIAWNWAAMTPLVRMALTGAVVSGSGLAAVLLGPDTRLGRVLLLVCGLAIGPMLAVFGQTYQTGAELWELFRVWTALLVLLALAGRQTGLWFAAWLVANIFAALWLGRGLASPFDALGQFFTVPEWLFAIGCAIVCWEWAGRRAVASLQQGTQQDDAYSWLCSRWMPRLLFFDLVSRTAFFLISMIFGLNYGTEHYALWLPHNFVVGFAVGVTGFSWWWYRTRQPDLFMLATLLAAGAAVLLSALAESELFFSAGTMIALLLWGLLVTSMTAGLAKVLLHLQHSMPAAPRRDAKALSSPSSIFGSTVAAVSWQELWAHLHAGGLVPQSQPLPQSLTQAGVHPSPWYVRVMLAFGGWLAAVFFVCFFGFVLFVGLDINSSEELAVFIASVPVLLVGWISLAREQLFVRHFGFALVIAGTVGVSIALCASVRSEALACFALAGVLFVLCLIMRNAAYRFLAVVGMGNSVAVGILFLIAEHSSGVAGFTTGGAAGATAVATVELIALWWGLVCLGLVYFCLREEKWRGPAHGQMADALFFGLYAALLLFQLATIGVNFGLADGVGVPAIATGHMGLGAGVGVAVLAFCLIRGEVQAAGGSAGRIAGGDEGSCEGQLSGMASGDASEMATAPITGMAAGQTGSELANQSESKAGSQAANRSGSQLANQSGNRPTPWILLAGLPLVFALGWYLPGAAVTLLGLLLARQMGSVVMQGFALAYLGVYMVFYYYNLAVPLAQKSLYMVVTGIVLLAVALVLRLWQAKLRVVEVGHA